MNDELRRVGAMLKLVGLVLRQVFERARTSGDGRREIFVSAHLIRAPAHGSVIPLP